jgi:hypothetical protein
MLRLQRPALLVGSVAILGAAALASANILGRAQDAAEAEALRLAAHAATLGQLELEARTREVEARAAAAASLNAVRALAAHRVDSRTLRDGFETEDWWRGFRAEFPVQLLLLGPERYEFGRKELGRALKTDSLVAEAIKHSPASAALRIEDTVLLAGAALVDVPLDPSRRPAVVVLAQPLSSEDLARVAARTRGAVAITGADHRVLGMSGPADEEHHLRELLVRDRPVLERATGAASSVSLGEGLGLWAYADARLASEAARRPAQTVVVVLWVLGLAACAGLIVASFRRREPPVAQEDVQHASEHPREEHTPVGATQDELRRAREEHALLEATQDELRGRAPSWTGSGPPCRLRRSSPFPPRRPVSPLRRRSSSAATSFSRSSVREGWPPSIWRSRTAPKASGASSWSSVSARTSPRCPRSCTSSSTRRASARAWCTRRSSPSLISAGSGTSTSWRRSTSWDGT